MFSFHAAAAPLHPLRWEPLVEARAGDAGVELLGEALGLCSSFLRSGESSQACRFASVSKRRMESQSSCTPGTGGSKR